MDKKDVKPFGLLFEEPVVPNLEIIIPTYDESEDISVIIDEHGNKTPYVEWNCNLGTKTMTKVAGESTDDDDGPKTLGTRTETFVSEEASSDIDDTANLFLGTKTSSIVDIEKTDDDNSEMQYNLPILGTKTATKTFGEGTDDDDE
jgi:hypothetical protein